MDIFADRCAMIFNTMSQQALPSPRIGAVALDADEKERLQHHKKHTDTRIEDAPTIRYDDAATVAGVQPEVTPTGPAKAVPTAAKRGKKSTAMAVTTAAAPTSPSAPTTPATPTSPASPAEEKRPREERPWTTEDQAALERALQAYPPSWKGEGDRWEKIAEGVEGRTKKECKTRVKAYIFFFFFFPQLVEFCFG